MAFTAAQKETLVSILGGTTDLLTAHITSLGATFTADKQTYIEAQMVRWAAGTGVTLAWFTPTESNEGYNTNKQTLGGDPAVNIARSLFWPYPVSACSMGTLQIG